MRCEETDLVELLEGEFGGGVGGGGGAGEEEEGEGGVDLGVADLWFVSN